MNGKGHLQRLLTEESIDQDSLDQDSDDDSVMEESPKDIKNKIENLSPGIKKKKND